MTRKWCTLKINILILENYFFEILAKKREEKIIEKKPRVVEVPRVREARVREGVLYVIVT